MSGFVDGLWKLYMYGRIYDPGIGLYRPRVRQVLDVVAGGNCRRHWFHEPQPNINQLVKVGGCTPCGEVLTPEISHFVPGLLELYMYGRSYDQGM